MSGPSLRVSPVPAVSCTPKNHHDLWSLASFVAPDALHCMKGFGQASARNRTGVMQMTTT